MRLGREGRGGCRELIHQRGGHEWQGGEGDGRCGGEGSGKGEVRVEERVAAGEEVKSGGVAMGSSLGRRGRRGGRRDMGKELRGRGGGAGMRKKPLLKIATEKLGVWGNLGLFMMKNCLRSRSEQGHSNAKSLVGQCNSLLDDHRCHRLHGNAGG
ncbi:unnamed protein product [Miscanthus lutarioriparius]|uniref:Uncharacterized protein n=1 Tax=Miscanthus lutarioriparius TaxID=422564 RepID=A0A811MKL4_9POAL|nr:unnamed protein product [Miscanthus lutarioriparius]